MGYYINPDLNTKAQWLSKNGELVSASSPLPKPSTLPSDKVLVCLVDNGHFNSAALVYDDREFRGFTEPMDHRHKMWFILDKQHLKDNDVHVDAGWERVLHV